MNVTAVYLCSLASIAALFAYFSPWYSDPREALTVSLMGGFWFFLAGWIIAIVDLVYLFVKLKKKEASWKHYGAAFGVIAVTYMIFIYGMSLGYVLTV